MKSKMRFFSLQNTKRARATAKRLTAILREYKRDPVRNFRMGSEAAALAMKVSYYLRQSETAGRIILTEDGKRRQVFLIDNANTSKSFGH
jgi:hypothetical protein